jgi:hypothetical protein
MLLAPDWRFGEPMIFAQHSSDAYFAAGSQWRDIADNNQVRHGWRGFALHGDRGRTTTWQGVRLLPHQFARRMFVPPDLPGQRPVCHNPIFRLCKLPLRRLIAGRLSHCRIDITAELLGQPDQNPGLGHSVAASLLGPHQYIQHAYANADNDRANSQDDNHFNQ